jgi:NAD(P)-dependent dehydrogenase (short-subunit alcohol dehydrogenase family)
MQRVADRLNRFLACYRHNLSTRGGRPEEIASAVAFLASDEAGFISRITIQLDGGLTAHLPSYRRARLRGARTA